MKKKSNKIQILKENFLKSLLHFPRKELKAGPDKKILEELLEEQLITKKDRHWILTEKGKKVASNIIRKHRIYETYLAKKTGYQETEWHKLAENREHYIDDETLNQWEKELGYPLIDPHGDLIPETEGSAQITFTHLNELEAEGVQYCKIIHLEDEPEEIFHELIRKGLYPGLVVRAEKLNGQWKLTFEGLETLLSPHEAELIGIKKVESKLWNPKVLRLSALKKGEKAKVIGISEAIHGLARQRLLDLGFVKNAVVSVYIHAPLKEPVAYDIKGATVALRKEQADKILIEKL